MIPGCMQAAESIKQADTILIGAGAGMGVDSGLPDFRGNEGFWRAYPPLKQLGLTFYDLADPAWFSSDPRQAWGFYGHRRNLYRQTEPHSGFAILKSWLERKPEPGFVFTSNVDGHFQASGFSDDRIVECHGTILFNQCAVPCCKEIWMAQEEAVHVDMQTFRAREPLPHCRFCGSCSRPNILMFGDATWLEARTAGQFRGYQTWLKSIRGHRLAIIEIGAGTAVPTVRRQCEWLARATGGTLIRINPREAHGQDVISVAASGLQALKSIDLILSTNRS